MSIRVALHHKTKYTYDRLVTMGPQLVRLKPAAHSRTPILAYSLKVEPAEQFVNWQQDPYGNFVARYVFPNQTRKFSVEVSLQAEMSVVNPFDFFIEASAESFPFEYEPQLKKELMPFLIVEAQGKAFQNYLAGVDRTPRRTIDFLVELNHQIQRDICYVIRPEPGIQTPDETLQKRSGSCRDSAWLQVQMLRHLGLAARFASGYLIQLTPDVKSLDGPSGTEYDFTDLHAWTEVFIPGAGWIGLDSTSGLLCGEGHIPLACTPDPVSAAPIAGGLDPCESTFAFEMTVTRIHEDPRVTKPYTDEQWRAITQAGHNVDRRLKASDVRLTMGGEPTFVSADDMEGDEWNTAAVGPTKRRRADALSRRIRERFAPGSLIHYGQGKWYPGEPLPRWAFTSIGRYDGAPVWHDPSLMADEATKYDFTFQDAENFCHRLAENLGVAAGHVVTAYEDIAYYAVREMRLPINVDVVNSKLRDRTERERLARIFERGLEQPTGVVLPLRRQWTGNVERWVTGDWPVRADQFYLMPGDSPMGLRLPLDSLPFLDNEAAARLFERDPLEVKEPLPLPKPIMKSQRRYVREPAPVAAYAGAAGIAEQQVPQRLPDSAVTGSLGGGVWGGDGGTLSPEMNGFGLGGDSGNGHGKVSHGSNGAGKGDNGDEAWKNGDFDGSSFWSGGDSPRLNTPAWIDAKNEQNFAVRTALTIEPRDGRLFVFLPPVETAEAFLDLISAIEQTCEELHMPVSIEGYLPPYDPRLLIWKVTPDPGVIEVNTPPTSSWDELVDLTTALYDEARLCRLGTEKFMLDGRHSGTGGGNHIVLGAARPSDSPFLRRPDLLRSLLTFWNNHPSLSYLLSGLFIGPTSQAPRVDEGLADALYELKIAFEELPAAGGCPPWLVDRIFRHLLVDLTGNTHRSEFCIDKLYSPDSSSGRLGLLELRAFEMPPHARMSLTQQLLVRTLIAWFWENPYTKPLVEWRTSLHDRFMLPFFLEEDFATVCAEIKAGGFQFEREWFAPHIEFRCPVMGQFHCGSVSVEVRTGLEPWYVLGEEPSGGGTSRYVDSSVERLQILVRGATPGRHVVTVNGRKVPLHSTGTEAEFVAGVRYRAWQPPSCLHPTIGVDAPLLIEVVDTWLERSIGGATYHVAHPGGRNYSTFPVNAYEAESRRIARFFRLGHTPGVVKVASEPQNCDYPFTLDLRRPPRAGGALV